MSTQDPQVVDPQEFIPVLDYQFSGDSVTVSNKRRIVEAYRIKASIYHAALAAGVARYTVYRYMNNDPQFAAAMQDSFEDSNDNLETSVYERAFKDNLLAMFWLKAHRPKFRDRMQVNIEELDSEIKARLATMDSKLLLPMITDAYSNNGSSIESSHIESSHLRPGDESEHKEKE